MGGKREQSYTEYGVEQRKVRGRCEEEEERREVSRIVEGVKKH